MNIPVDNPLFWITAIVGVFLTGISKSGFAGGAGVVAVPLLALVIDVPVAAALMLPLLLLMDAKTIHYYWRNANMTMLRQLLSAALVGILAGALLLGSMPERELKMTLGVICICFACWQAFTPFLRRFGNAGYFWGAVSGASSTLIHAGGPPLNIYLLVQKLPRLQWLATASIFFGCVNLLKVVPYAILGQWNAELFKVVLLLVPAAFAGIAIGRWVQSRFSDAGFIMASRVLLAFSGVLLLYGL